MYDSFNSGRALLTDVASYSHVWLLANSVPEDVRDMAELLQDEATPGIMWRMWSATRGTDFARLPSRYPQRLRNLAASNDNLSISFLSTAARIATGAHAW